MTSVTVPDGSLTLLNYDRRDRAVQTVPPSAGRAVASIIQSFDGANNLTGVNDPRSLATLYSTDGLGRLKIVTSPDSGAASASYDAAGNLPSDLVANGKTRVLSYAYGTTGSANGQLSGLSVNPVNSNGVGPNGGVTLTVLSAISYNPNGITGWTWGDGSSTSRSYDSFGRVLSYPLGKPSGTGNAAGLTRTLAYDFKGNITAYTHANSAGPQSAYNQSFSYDARDRLIGANVAGTPYTYTYGYDQSGNRSSETVGAASYSNTIARGGRSALLGRNALHTSSWVSR